MEQVVDRESNNAAISQTTAIKFLMARKFDVTRALTLYAQHQVGVTFTCCISSVMLVM